MASSQALSLANLPNRVGFPSSVRPDAPKNVVGSSAAISSAVTSAQSSAQISAQAQGLYKSSIAAAAAPTYSVANALKLGVSASDGSLQISDSAANIGKNFDKLIAMAGKINAIKQTDAVAVGLSEAQFSAGLAPSPANGLLSKINNGQFKVAVSGVHLDNLAAIASYGSKVVAITIADTSDNIAQKISDISALGSKVSAITQTTKSAIVASYADTVLYAGVFSKIDKGNYTLKLTDTCSNIKANLSAITKLGGKVSGITQTDDSEVMTLNAANVKANLVSLQKIMDGSCKVNLQDSATGITQNWAALLSFQKNISSLNFTDAAELKLTASQATGGADLFGKVSSNAFRLTVSDSATNLTTNLSGLLSINDKISQVNQTGSGSISVSQQRLGDDTMTSFLGKLNPTGYTLTVTDASKQNLASVVANTHVKAVVLNVSDGTLTSSDANTAAALSSSKITAITVSNASIANLSVLSADKRVKSIGITDSAVNLSNATSLQSIDTLMKKSKGLISAINLNDAGRKLISVSQAAYTQFAATVFSVPKNYALEVDFGTPPASSALSANQIRSALKTTAKSNGTFGVQVWDFKKGGFSKAVTLNAGVNFVKLAGTSTFLDSGDAKLNAVLNVGSFNWQQNPTQDTASTSDYSLKPGVFALGDGSAKQNITYKFLNSSSDASLSAMDKKGFESMNADQKSAVTRALNYISSLVNINFQLVDAGQKADINFGTNTQTASGGYATGANAALGNVNLMLNKQSSVNTKPLAGDYGWETVIHEIGHTLGLKHPGAYNAGGGTAPGPYLASADDNRRNTVMSYYNPSDAAVNWVSAGAGYSSSGVNPSTFMPLDILALQFLYGKNTTGTSLSDDSLSLADFQTTQFTSDWMGMETLSSTTAGLSLDLSNVTASNIVDLRAGAFSSINIKESSYNVGIGGAIKQTFYNFNNVGLAYDASVSSMVGGSSSDVVYVASNDVQIDGGAGNDKVYLYGNASDWIRSEDSGETVYTNGNVTAKLKNVESVAYYAFASTSTMHTRVDLTA